MTYFTFKNYLPLTRLSFIALIFSTVLSCNRSSSKQSNDNTSLDSINAFSRKIAFVSPVSESLYKIGEEIKLKVKPLDTIVSVDSLQFLVNGARLGSIDQLAGEYTWKTRDANAGSTYISALAFKDSAVIAQENIAIRLYPALPPKQYTYEIINTYPHSTSSYTQGLVFDQGKMFEGGGLYEKSTLREVNLVTGESLKEYTLPRNVFGEGITVYKDKIIQISWKEQLAFVYNKSTFELISRINYPIKEGWGITFDGTYLIMSDGSSILYFLNPEDMTEHNRIEVCDENGPVIRLNELEYINGEIWANVYTTDTIVRINPKTGVVTGRVDMAGLLRPADKAPETDVLNGIAYDPKTDRIWVTGKFWPKLFQIAVVPKEK